MKKPVHERIALTTTLWITLVVAACVLPGCKVIEKTFRKDLYQTRKVISQVDTLLSTIPSGIESPIGSSYTGVANELTQLIQKNQRNTRVADQLRVRLARLYLHQGDITNAKNAINSIDPTRDLPNARDQAFFDLFPTTLWWQETRGNVPSVGFAKRAEKEIQRINSVIRPLMSEKQNQEIAEFYSELAVMIAVELIDQTLPKFDRIQQDDSWASAKRHVASALDLFGEVYGSDISSVEISHPKFIRAEVLVGEIGDALKDPSSSKSAEVPTGRAYVALQQNVLRRTTKR